MMQIRFLSGALFWYGTEGRVMAKTTKKLTETMRFKEPKIRKTKSYSNRRWIRRVAEWLRDYYRVVLPIVLCVVLIVFVVILMLNRKANNERLAEAENSVAEQDSQNYQVVDAPLEENADEELNAFFADYYEAMASGDTERFLAMRDATNDTQRISMEKKAQYVESYDNLTVYTKPGPLENTTVAFVYFEVQFSGVEGVAPGLSTYYVISDEENGYRIGVDAEDDSVSEFIDELFKQDDVDDLFNKVQINYSEVMDTNEALHLYMNDLTEKLKNDVGEALARLELENQGIDPNGPTVAETNPEDTPDTAPDTPTTPVENSEFVKANEKVNVRSDSNTNCERVGVAQKGEIFERLEVLDNGWSKIVYKGKEAYIMSKFLVVVTDVIGSVTVTENVNVRASSSKESSKLGSASKGEVFDLLEEIPNGWSKINYYGEPAYIKTEYLRRN